HPGPSVAALAGHTTRVLGRCVDERAGAGGAMVVPTDLPAGSHCHHSRVESNIRSVLDGHGGQSETASSDIYRSLHGVELAMVREGSLGPERDLEAATGRECPAVERGSAPGSLHDVIEEWDVQNLLGFRVRMRVV